MPERWQHELRKLGDERMPPEVRERVERGPRRASPGDGRRRLVAGMVAFSVFIAAGAFAWRAFDRSDVRDPAVDDPSTAEIVEHGADVVVIAVIGTQDGPAATMTSPEGRQSGVRGSFTWCDGDDCLSREVRPVYPPVSEYTPVAPGAPFEPSGDGALTRLVVRTPDGGHETSNVVADTDGTDASAPTEPGRYVVWISSTWGDRGHAEFWLGIEVMPRTDEIPDVLHLTCTPDRATLDSAVVRPRSDGLHVVVDASDEVVGIEAVNDPSEPFGGIGGPLHDDGEQVLLLEPRRWHVGCYARGGGGGVEVGAASARFTMVDPDGVYTPVALVCHEPTTRLFPVSGAPASGVDGRYEPAPRTVDESVAAVPGILATDVVREAGYPDGPGFKIGPIHTVLRDGRPLARLRIPVEVSGVWGVSVDACPGTGIGPDAPPGAAGPTPDTAVVRCLESRTEVATPIVNAQADGLHLEVQNVGGTEAVTVMGGWEPNRTFTVPVADQGEAASVVVPAHPGRVKISCRSNAETDRDDPFVDRHSQELRLQDPSGYFLPYAPACDSSEHVPFETADPGVLPTNESAIRARVAGIVDDDVVERAGFLEGPGDEGLWRVVRDGEVAGYVLYPAQEGIACRGSGIGGA